MGIETLIQLQETVSDEIKSNISEVRCSHDNCHYMKSASSFFND